MGASAPEEDSGLRVLAVANHLGARGGLERTQLTTCRALAARGHRLDVIYASAGDFAGDWRSFAGAMVEMTGSLPRRRAPLSSVAGLAAAVVRAARLRPDALYVYRYWDLPFAVAVGALARAPVVFHLCLPPPTRIPSWLRGALGRVDATLSVSEDTARRWQGSGLRPERVAVVTTGIDTEYFDVAPPGAREATRLDLGIGDGDYVVLYAGRIGREKGVDVLLRAARDLAPGLAPLRVVIVGGPSLGADPADSERYVAELHALADGIAVAWLGPRGDVRPLLQMADVAVVPSLWPEPFSRAVMEPLACGIPVIASRVGGTPEILTGWLSQYLVDPGDAGALAAQISSVRDWRADDPDLALRCRRVAVDQLSLEHEVDAVEAAIAAAVRARAAKPVGARRAPTR